VIDLQPAKWTESISIPSFQKAVLNWYQNNARDLPWRQTTDPYKIWISEVMLQQTQVATVIPYWNRFCQSFPTVSDLAEADESEVLRHWEGLGYYRRARQLHAAAKKVTREFDGNFPGDFRSVLSLPGIGRYTASAVLSISKNLPLPILEGNTIRLFSRLSGLQEDPTTSQNQKLLWGLSEEAVSAKETGKFNQGLMEIGALVCSVADPRCTDCPVKKFCRAKKENLQSQIPAPKTKKTQYESVCHSVVVIQRRGKYLLRQCQEGEFFQGLWDFPRVDSTRAIIQGQGKEKLDHASVLKNAECRVKAAGELVRWAEEKLGLQVQVDLDSDNFRHAVTKYRILLLVFSSTKVQGTVSAKAKLDGWKWFGKKEIAQLPLSATGRKIFQGLKE